MDSHCTGMFLDSHCTKAIEQTHNNLFKDIIRELKTSGFFLFLPDINLMFSFSLK